MAAIKAGAEQKIAMSHFPSRGQTAEQKLYQTKMGKLFLKKVSDRNHRECQIDTDSGTLAEREFWSYKLANKIGLSVPKLTLIDELTTVQEWLDHPDAHIYATYQGRLDLETENVFECALFDWVTGQIDRHDANYLYDFVTHQIILIDSAHAFLKHGETLPDYLRLFEVAYPKKIKKTCHNNISNNLKQLTEDDLRVLIPLRNTDEAKALQNRFQKIKNIETIENILHLYRANT
ncbi:hypothetical protein BVY03_01450 [bacterium K02(2017)]|nr:hypothetical protein BVY03_01450 [bacterium K02(2017)]